MSKTVNVDGAKALAGAGVAIIDSPDVKDIQTVADGDLASIAADEAFLNEPVKIRIHPTINPNDPPVVVLTCNSAAERVVVGRGQPTVVKRKHLEILARVRETRYAQKQAFNADLESGNFLYASVGQVYPFEVIEDKNPKGRAWLENIMAEPV